MLLSVLLLPLLKSKSPAGSPGRLTIVTSMLSLTAKFAQKDKIPLLKAFDEEKTFDGVDIYPTSKYLGLIFLWKLTDLVSADDVVVNCVEPGFVKGTSLQREAPAAIRFMLYLLKVTTARSMKLGATTYLDAAITKGKESHGCILMNWGIAP
jgi:NAD(P)-dependent dehydrogenase (short-subunit alcohol dehydrogenase family)